MKYWKAHIIVILFLFFSTSVISRELYIVNSANDIDDGVCNSTHCSLREAINASNVDGDNSDIDFNIPGSGIKTISITSSLPYLLANETHIDGTSQLGYTPEHPSIIIDGSNTSSGTVGLALWGDDCRVDGVKIRNFPDNGIAVARDVTEATIGVLGKGNVIENNGYHGISIFPGANKIRVTGNTIRNNAIDGIYLDRCIDARIRYNTINNNRYAVYRNSASEVEVNLNSVYCNSNGLFGGNGRDLQGNFLPPAPIVNNYSTFDIEGVGQVGSSVDIYIHRGDPCNVEEAQGFTHFGTANVNDGSWRFAFGNPNSMNYRDIVFTEGDVILVTTTYQDQTSYPVSFVVGGEGCNQLETNYTVTTIDDTDDLDPADRICRDVNGNCSLRAAVQQSNFDNKNSRIIFDDLDGPIQITRDFPYIFGQLEIDGGTTGQIRIDGSLNDEGIYFDGSCVELYGLHFQKFQNEGVVFLGGSDFYIGAPNKGCVFTENKYAIWLNGQIDNFSVKSSFFGTTPLYEDGLGNINDIDLSGSTSTTIENVTIGGNFDSDDSNIFANTTEFSVGLSFYSSNVRVIGNYFGYDRSLTKPMFTGECISIESGIIGGSYAQRNVIANARGIAIRAGSDQASEIVISHNEIINNSVAINSTGTVKVSNNTMRCNTRLILGNHLDEPTITYANDVMIEGNTDPLRRIDVYLSDTTDCVSLACQPTYFLGSTMADGSGVWSLESNSGFGYNSGDGIVALAYDEDDVSSHVSDCYFILPDDCRIATRLPVNLDPCSAVGAITDLTQLRGSIASLSPSCSDTYLGSDAWYDLIVPNSSSLLLRVNINNTVIPVMQIYQNPCDALQPLLCTELDSIPFALALTDYNPGERLYVRIWDSNNLIVNSGITALLHISAHELPSESGHWRLCDMPNNPLSSQVLLSRRDATNFILEYDDTISPTELAANEEEFVQAGLSLSDQCLCGEVPLQLWGADNIIDLEGVIARTRKKPKVDTTNYNYLFEDLEFQVNSYAIGFQYDTHTAMGPNGRFIMTWHDQQRNHNYARIYNVVGNPLTQEFRIGGVQNTQVNTQVLALSDTSFIAYWQENDEQGSVLMARKITWNGGDVGLGPIANIGDLASANITTEEEVKGLEKHGNTITATYSGDRIMFFWNNQAMLFYAFFTKDLTPISIGADYPAIKSFDPFPEQSIHMNASGKGVLVWKSGDKDDSNVYRQVLEDGVIQGNSKIVNSFSDSLKGFPNVHVFEDGHYVIVWESAKQDNNDKSYGIYGQTYSANDQKEGVEFRINSYTQEDQRHPSIVGLASGDYYVSWDSYGQDGVLEGIFGQLFDRDDNKLGDELQINVLIDPEQELPHVTSNGKDVILTAWEDGGNDGSYKGIFAQRHEVRLVNGVRRLVPISTTTPSKEKGVLTNYSETYYTPDDEVSRVRVAILDTGIERDNFAIRNGLWTNTQLDGSDACVIDPVIGYDFVNESADPVDLDGHGTQVAGIISRDFDPNVRLEMMSLKIHEKGEGKVFDAICAIYFAVNNGANIINLSWGFEAQETPSILKKALKYASDNDVLVITSAGNTSKNIDSQNKYPASLDIENMIVTAAYQQDIDDGEKRLSVYSSRGKNTVDIAALGYFEVPTIGNVLTTAAGTSLAAPEITRSAAIIKGLYPSLPVSDIKTCILSSATYDENLEEDVSVSGFLNHSAALDCARIKAEDCLGIDVLMNVYDANMDHIKTEKWIRTKAIIPINRNLIMLAKEGVYFDDEFQIPESSSLTVDIGDCSEESNGQLKLKTIVQNKEFSIDPFSRDAGKIRCVIEPTSNKAELSLTRMDNATIISSESFENLSSKSLEKIVDLYNLPAGNYKLAYHTMKVTIEYIIELRENE